MISTYTFKLVALSIVIFWLITESDAWWWSRRRRRRRSCSTTPCTWKWGTCSRTCGGGLRYATKTANEGSCGSCSMPKSPGQCNIQCCPVHCSWKIWSSWGSCSRPCGGGTQTRTRSQTSPSCGGKSCSGSYKESRSCNNQCCPIDCKWTSWGSWGSCSKLCGGGSQFRTRSGSTPSCGGKSCTGNSVETKSCNIQCCSVDCKWSSWGSWGACSAKCGGGFMTKVRTFATDSACGGKKCIGSSSESKNCNSQCCPVNCKWGPWSGWEKCSETCGGGVQMKTRKVSQIESCGGTPCFGYATDSTTCNEQCCPVNCSWEEWSKWGVCSKTCGSGSQTRFRDISIASHCGGTECVGKKQESQLCNEQCCPVDCEWGPWGDWGSCSKTCDQGRQSRNRLVAVLNDCGGFGCTGSDTDTKICNDFCCPVDCRWRDWSKWSNCSKTCGTGIQLRSRTKDVTAVCNGKHCVGEEAESKECNTLCCPVNCLLSLWNEWSQCSSTCGTSGIQSRKRTVDRAPECGGNFCEDPLEEKRSCNRVCFNNGEVGDEDCICQDGWEGECCEQDIDECDLGLHNCTGDNQMCENAGGSFTCQCEGALVLIDGECQDIDECALQINNCSELGLMCKNIFGGFECGCPDSLTLQNGQCIDIDECALGTDVCAQLGLLCKNTYGGYECGCEKDLILKNGQCVEPTPSG